MESPGRRSEWRDKLLGLFEELSGMEWLAWVVLPNHYHLLARVNLPKFGTRLGRLHNGTSTQWNREDCRPGRKVWYRFTDRAIRSERHYYTALNYIHGNPVKHGYVDSSRDWEWSSFFAYEQSLGIDEMRRIWKAYPVDQMGAGWDEC